MRRAFGTPPVRSEPLDAAELATFKDHRCPDCKGTLREGAHGELSINWICNRCGRVFNDRGEGVDRFVEEPPRHAP